MLGGRPYYVPIMKPGFGIEYNQQLLEKSEYDMKNYADRGGGKMGSVPTLQPLFFFQIKLEGNSTFAEEKTATRIKQMSIIELYIPVY